MIDKQMMNYSNQCHDSISTVQLSPFAEDQWNRIATYSPIYVHWTDVALMSAKRTPKSTSAKRHLGSTTVSKSARLDDEILLDELHQVRRTIVGPTLKQKTSFNEARFLEEEHDERATSPTDEYQKYTDFFYQTREPQYSNRQHYTKTQVDMNENY
jgi:hypothetical protein